MILKGKSWKFGDDINTDEIIPARYLNTTNPEFLASHCMEDAKADFSKVAKSGDIIVAGKNFGCGSSREHAPLCIKAFGISCVIAVSFARIFYRNSFNIGLPIFETKDAEKIKEGDVVEVDTVNGAIKNVTKNETYEIAPIPGFMQELIDCGGLMEYAKKMQKK
jgi:3-isopropylmalate dehydratase small subunit